MVCPELSSSARRGCFVQGMLFIEANVVPWGAIADATI